MNTKKCFYLALIFTGILIPVLNVKAQYRVIDNETTRLLNRSIGEKEALIWYLGHDGFAIKTRNNILIIDPYNVGMEHEGLVSADASLGNGSINPGEIRNFKVTVFSSNLRNYSTGIWLWQQFIYDITYVFGWDPVIGIPYHEYIFMKPGEEKMIGDIDATTIQATEDGSAFLLKVDGLVIFHGGDHGIYTMDMKERFTAEIDLLSGKTGNCDLAFIDFQVNAGERRPSITSGIWYVNEKLNPRVIFPMGAMNTNRGFGATREPRTSYENLIPELISEAPTAEIKSRIVETDKIGNVFFYKDGVIYQVLQSTRE